MPCQRCDSRRIVTISGKCADMAHTSIGNAKENGYVPLDLGVGGGDYIRVKYCLECGQLQGEWPLPQAEIELGSGEDEPAGEYLVDGEMIPFYWTTAIVLEYTVNGNVPPVQLLDLELKFPSYQPKARDYNSKDLVVEENLPEDYPFDKKLPLKIEVLCNIKDIRRLNHLEIKGWRF